MVMSLLSNPSALVEHARFSPWLFKKADFQMGHLLELALYRHQRRITHLVIRFFPTSDTYRRLVRGSRDSGHQASTPKLPKDIEGGTRQAQRQTKTVCHCACVVRLYVTTAWKSPKFPWGAFPGLDKSGR